MYSILYSLSAVHMELSKQARAYSNHRMVRLRHTIHNHR